jgi:NifU-like protein involved in Fe-S cluster formation
VLAEDAIKAAIGDYKSKKAGVTSNEAVAVH